jgi:hypothetical protein
VGSRRLTAGAMARRRPTTLRHTLAVCFSKKVYPEVNQLVSSSLRGTRFNRLDYMHLLAVVHVRDLREMLRVAKLNTEDWAIFIISPFHSTPTDLETNRLTS